MSFEKHHLVSPFLAVYENGHSGFENKEQLFEKIARTLHEELVKYQEQEALRQGYTLPNLIARAKAKMLDELHAATSRGDWEAVSVLSAALQRTI